MELSQFQELIIKVVERYCAQFNIPLTTTYAQLKLYEEVGEFAQAVLAHRMLVRPSKLLDAEKTKAALADELTDIIGIAILNAHLLDIDLEEAFARKWFNKLDVETEDTHASHTGQPPS